MEDIELHKKHNCEYIEYWRYFPGDIYLKIFLQQPWYQGRDINIYSQRNLGALKWLRGQEDLWY
jgi:hypothetical protein